MTPHPLLECLARLSTSQLRWLRVNQLKAFPDSVLWNAFGDILVRELQSRTDGAPRPEIEWPQSTEQDFLLRGHEAVSFGECLPELADYSLVRLLFVVLARSWMLEADLQKKLQQVGGQVN